MKKILEKLFENGLIASLFLGLAYLLTYQYQKGKLSYYNIPLIYVDLDIANVIEIFIYILSFVYILQFVLTFIADNIPQIKTYKGRQILFFTIAYFSVLILSLILFKKNADFAIISTIAYFGYIFITLLIPKITIKGNISYKEKWLQSSEKSENYAFKDIESRKTMHLYPQRKQITTIGLIICIMMSVCNTFELAGKNNARMTEEYYIAIDYNDKIVVHYTDDYYILMECNNNNILKKEYHIVPANEIGIICLKNTGKLHAETDNEKKDTESTEIFEKSTDII